MQQGSVEGQPRKWLRLDGAVLFVASAILFSLTHQAWWIFPAILFVPDIFMLGYVRNTRVGALLYNSGHNYFLPSLLMTLG
jgi:Domain of unknown function (DUF4260)